MMPPSPFTSYTSNFSRNIHPQGRLCSARCTKENVLNIKEIVMLLYIQIFHNVCTLHENASQSNVAPEEKK